jgi:DNA-binding NarL/FixJ family response regulator
LRVLIVDDHALFRDGLALILRSVDASTEVTHAADVPSALQALGDGAAPDLVLLDLALPGVAGAAAVRMLRQQAEQCPVVVLSGSDDMRLVRECIDAGAMGFIPKASDSRSMLEALARVLQGNVVLPEIVATVDTEGPESRLELLTPRQTEVLQRLVQGKSNRVIADELGIVEHTVKSHVSVVLQVLQVSNRTEAVYALRHVRLDATGGR